MAISTTGNKIMSWIKIITIAVPFIVTAILLADGVITNSREVPELKTRITCLEMTVQMNQEEHSFLIRELIKKILPSEQSEQIISLADLHKKNTQKLIEEQLREARKR